jgi:hypothetical protein
MNDARDDSFDTLIIGASFFGYVLEIKAALEARGRRVRWVEDRPATDVKTRVLVRLHPALVASQSEAYFRPVIEAARRNPVTEVLVIKGEACSVEMLNELRKACPKARFTLYYWDSYRNMPGDSHEKVDVFDRAFSFDPIDCDHDKRLHFRPLFYLDRFRELPQVEQDVDVLFLGTVHTDRYRVLKRIEEQLPPDLRFVQILYYPSKKLFQARRLIDPRMWGARRREFIFEPIAGGTVNDLFARTRIAVDIERSVQSGFTIRTIEMLGASKKLITTNPRITRADFYDPNNVAVINRWHPQLEEAFLRRPYRPVAPAIMDRYSLSGWLDEVLPS